MLRNKIRPLPPAPNPALKPPPPPPRPQQPPPPPKTPREILNDTVVKWLQPDAEEEWF
jgi:hypothetical protein